MARECKVWQLKVWNGHKHTVRLAAIKALTPKEAIKAAGYGFGEYTIKYSRVGYGHYTGRIYIWLPETTAAGVTTTVTADAIIEVVNY